MDDDRTLKELLKEEKRRRGKERSKDNKEKRKEGSKDDKDRRKEGKVRDDKEQERRRREKERRRKEREESVEKERRRKEREGSNEKERKVESVEKIEVEVKDEDEKFMFVFEDENGKLYSSLDKIGKKEGGEIKIFPVYISGGNSNLTEEVVIFLNGELNPSDENKETSWLSVINSDDPKIKTLSSELKDVVIYNSKFYHCMDDFIDYVELFGPDVLPIE